MRRYKIKVLLFLVFLISITFAQTNFEFTHYTEKEGLPESYICDVLQDDNGLIWISTLNGIYNYDGNRWNLKKKIMGEYKLAKGRNNSIIVYHSIAEKIDVYQNESWISIEEPISLEKLENEPGGIIDLVFMQSSNGFLIFSTKRIFVYEDKTWKEIKINFQKKNESIYDVENTETGYLVATNFGLYKKNNHNSPVEKFHKSTNTSLINITRNKFDGQIWILSNKWIGKIENSQITIVKKFKRMPIKLGNVSVWYHFFEVFGDLMFFGNRSIIYYFDKNNDLLNKLDSSNGLVSEGATELICDREGQFWISNFRGLNKLKKIDFLMFTKKDGLLDNEVASIAQTNDSTLVCGYNDGIGFIKNKKVINYQFDYINYEEKVFSRVFELKAKKNKVYGVASYLGLFVADKRGILKFNKNGKNSEYNAIQIHSDKILTTTLNSVDIFDFDLKFLKRLTHNKIYTTVVDSINKDIYGLGGNHTIWALKEEQISSIEIPSIYIIYNIKNIDGVIYFCTRNGLYAVDEKYLYNNNKYQQLFKNRFYSCEVDSKGNIWFGTDKGLLIKTKEGYQTFDVTDGLPSNETNRNANLCDFEGNMWIGTPNGLCKFTDVPNKKNKIKPLIKITGIKNSEGFNESSENKYEFDNNLNDFEINYYGISFWDENKNIFEIKTKNLITGDSSVYQSKERIARYMNQLPGTYEISVRMKNALNIWSDSDSVIVKIDKPYYRKSWFVLLLVLTLISIIIFVQNYFSKLGLSKKLETLVQIKTQELEVSNKKYEIIAKTIEEVIWTFDEEFNLIYVSPTVKKIHNIHPDILYRFDKRARLFFTINSKYKIFDTKEIKTKTTNNEVIFKNINGEEIFIEFVSSPIMRKNKFSGIIVISRDISERKLQENNKKKAIINNIEEERNRIARDLHDHIGQIITSVKLRLEIADLKGQMNDDLHLAYDQIKVVRKEIRNAIDNLSPFVENSNSFEDACTELCKNYKGEINISCNLNSDLYLLKNDEKLMIYRIIQEALSNSVKHSNAKNIILSVIEEKNKYKIIIKDDGIGFKFNESKKLKKYGMVNMIQRAELLNADIEIKSELNKGTEITLRI